MFDIFARGMLLVYLLHSALVGLSTNRTSADLGTRVPGPFLLPEILINRPLQSSIGSPDFHPDDTYEISKVLHRLLLFPSAVSSATLVSCPSTFHQSIS